MTDDHFSIRIERAASDTFAWVIMEERDSEEPFEVAASLKTYDKPSDAVRAAEEVLAALFPAEPQDL